MPIYILLEYSNNYSTASGRLRNYYRDEVKDSANEIDNDNKINNNKKISKPFEYRAKIIGRTPNNILEYTRCRCCCSFKIFE